jgi:hypothetical protein
VALQPGVHYLDCGLERPADTSPAPADQYRRVSETILTALEQPQRVRAVGHAAASYFDEHAAPDRVGAYLAERLRELLAR